MSPLLAVLLALVSGGVGVLVGRLTKRLPPPAPPTAPDPSLVSWSLPPELLARAKALTDEVETAEASGEYKRHQVYARLIKEFPSTPRRALSKAIEAVLVGLLVLWAVPAFAQTAVANPTVLEFQASPDHALLGLDDQPLVARYEARIFLSGTLVESIDLGKPTPAAGLITVSPINSWLLSLVPNKRHVARVAAIGPTGEGESTDSNPFGRTAPPAAGGPPSVRR